MSLDGPTLRFIIERIDRASPLAWLDGLVLGIEHASGAAPVEAAASDAPRAPPVLRSVSPPRRDAPRAKPLTPAMQELHRQARALIELDSGITARGLRSAIDLVDNDKRWNTLRRALAQDSDVVVEGNTNALRYRWAGGRS